MGLKDKASEAASKTKRRIGMERPLAAEEGGRVGIVRGALQSFGSGDMDGFLDALKDDAPFECPEGENFPGAGEHSGADEVKETFVADVGRTYTSFGFEPELFVEADDDDAVIVFGRFVGDGAAGDNVDTRACQVWEFKGNTVEAIRIYADSAAFPEVVTEEQLEKEKEEERKQQEEDEDGDKDTEAKSDSDDDGDSEKDSDDGDDDDDTESKSDDDTESKSDDDTESKSDDDTESKSDDDTESKSDDDTEAKSDDSDDSDDEQPRSESEDDTESSSDNGSDVKLARAGDDQAEREKQESQQS